MKAQVLMQKHQQQLKDVPLSKRFIWTDKSTAADFTNRFGGFVTSEHPVFPWRLLYDASGEFVAYVKEYDILQEVKVC